MNTDFEKKLNFDGDTFSDIRRDMNFVLQRLLGNMKEKESVEGSMTLKIDVSFAEEFIPNFNPKIESETRKISKPKFKHKVTSAVQIKDEKSGSMDTEMELVLDEETGEYIMRHVIDTAQRTIFDAEYSEVMNGSASDEEYESLALPGRKVAALPSPTDMMNEPEGAIDGEVIEEELEDVTEEILEGDFDLADDEVPEPELSDTYNYEVPEPELSDVYNYEEPEDE